MSTFASFVPLLEGNVSETLISAACWEKIEAVAALVSADISGFFGFEKRLTRRDGEVDFLFHVTPKTGGETVLKRDIEAGRYASRNSTWKCVEAFADLWNEKRSSLARGGDNVWFEFDIAGESEIPPLPEPNLFFGPDKDFCRANGSRWVVEEVLPVMAGTPLPPASAAQISAIFDSLPEPAEVFQIGTMLARPTRFIRFCVRGLGAERILPFLETLGWKDGSGRLERLLESYAPLTDRIDFDLDFIKQDERFELGPKVGLECYVVEEERYPERWDALLRNLAEAGLCLEDLRGELFYYPDIVELTETNRALWPRHLTESDAFYSPGHRIALAKFLHHVKLVYDKNKLTDATEAKAYAAVMVHWLEGGKDTEEKAALRRDLQARLPKEALSRFLRTEPPS